MKNLKTMTQTEYDNFVSLELIPDLEDEYGEFDTLIIKDNQIQFAKICNKCGDVILLGKTFDINNKLTIIDFDSKTRYFEILTDLDVCNFYDVLECECYDKDNESFYDGSNEDDDTYLDLDEDYGDGNYEY